MNPVVLYGGYVLILINVPQRVEVLLLAVVRGTASEFDQYISQVLSLCNTFFKCYEGTSHETILRVLVRL